MTPKGSQQSAHEPRRSSKTLQMLGLEWWHPKAKTKRLRPLRGRYFIRFAVRGCRFAQPPANSLNPFGVLLSRRLVYNDGSQRSQRRDKGGYRDVIRQKVEDI